MTTLKCMSVFRPSNICQKITSIFEKLHIEEKYFGRKAAPAKLDCRFLFFSSRENMWMVPWSLATHNSVEVELKLRQYMLAGCVPRRNSVNRLPVPTSNTRISVPFSLAVANLVPKMFTSSVLIFFWKKQSLVLYNYIL